MLIEGPYTILFISALTLHFFFTCRTQFAQLGAQLLKHLRRHICTQFCSRIDIETALGGCFDGRQLNTYLNWAPFRKVLKIILMWSTAEILVLTAASHTLLSQGFKIRVAPILDTLFVQLLEAFVGK